MVEARYPSLKNRHVLVTGGGSGIGAAIVTAFAAQGSRVSFIDNDEKESNALLEKCPGVRFVKCDLTDLDALHGVLENLLSDLGRIDVLVNNAARDDRHNLADISPAFFDRSIAVNLRHFVFASRSVAPEMIAAAKGVILNLGSVSWHLGLADLLLYETAKAGIEGFTRALARDLGPSGIRVACIVPGKVETARQQKWYTPEAEAEIALSQCLPIFIQPDDVAALALFLASDDARCCTGHSYFVDAGWS